MFTKILRKISANYPRDLYLSNRASNHRATLISDKTLEEGSTIPILEIVRAAKIPVEFDVINNFDFSNPDHCETLRKNRCILLDSNGVDNPTTDIPKIHKYLNLHTSCVKIFNPDHLKRDDIPAFEIISESIHSDPSTEEVEIAPRTFRSLTHVNMEKMKKVARFAFQEEINDQWNRMIVVYSSAATKLEVDTLIKAMEELRGEYPMVEYSNLPIEDFMTKVASDYNSLKLIVTTSGDVKTVAKVRDILSPINAVGLNVSVGDEHILYNQKHLPRGLTMDNNSFDPTSLLVSLCCMLKNIQLYQHSDLLLLALKRVHKDRDWSSSQDENCTAADFMKSLHEELTSLTLDHLHYE